MKSGDITRVTGVPELTWCYNRNTEPALLCGSPGVYNELLK